MYLSKELGELLAGLGPRSDLDGDGARVDVRGRRVQHGEHLIRRGGVGVRIS